MDSPNPYNYNLPVEPAMFFGRQAEVATLAGKLIATPGDSVALIGGRRMGKTSMLEALRRELEASAESPRMLLPIFLDLSGEGITSVPAFFSLISEQTQAGLARSLSLPADIGTFSGGQLAVPAFRRLLETWGRAALEQRGRPLRLVLLLDECEEIVEQPWAADLHTALRALLVGQSTRSLLKVVMAGSHSFLTQVRQRGSPLWNVLAYHMLRVFDEPATRDLIARPTGNAFGDDVVEVVVEQSGGQPFLAQYLLHNLWNHGLGRGTPDLARRIAAAFHHQRNDFADWAAGLGQAGLRAYDVLAASAEPLAERDIRTLLQPAPMNLAQTLDALCYHGVALREADGEHYRVAGAMFRMWFATRGANPDGIGEPDELYALIDAKQRRLKILERQQAHYGIDTPAHIVLEIEDLRREIAELKRMIGSA